MENPIPLDDSEAERNRQLDEELRVLQKEREQILAAAEMDSSPMFQDLEKQVKNRFKLAAEYRDLQLANLRSDFKVELQQARNEFQRGKRALLSEILSISVDRRRRLDALRSSSVAKKKKRSRSVPDKQPKFRPPQKHTFLASLERQGMVRVALTPDEVNNDLAVILQGIDSAKANGPLRSSVDRPHETSAKNVDKIHSSRGILHYHDINYEKGDQVAIYAHSKAPGPKLLLKYSGELLSINSKEITIREGGKLAFRKHAPSSL